MRTEDELRARLRAWVQQKARGIEVGDGTPLFERRILRSVHLPELVLLLERLRGAPIDLERLWPGDFHSIDVMVQRFGGTPERDRSVTR
jgi:hypothetical protein